MSAERKTVSTAEYLAASVARADYKEGDPASEVRRLVRRFKLGFELGKQSPGDGAIYTLILGGRDLVRGRGRKEFVGRLHAFEEGFDLGERSRR